MQLEFHVRLTFENGTEECNCFSTFEEAETAYHDRLNSEDEPCEIELVQVHCQHEIPAGGYDDVGDVDEALSEQMKNC